MKSPILSLALLAAYPSGAAAEPRFACDVGALTPEERTRSRALHEELKRATLEQKPIDNGVAFRLPSTTVVTAAQWIDLERRCCPFFDLALEQTRDHGPLWLRVSGAPGVARFIESELQR